MITSRDGRISFLIKSLIALIFIAKISLGSVLPIPRSFSFLIFQSGLHPVLNVFLCVLFGVPLLILFMRVRDRFSLSPFYKIFLVVLCLTLSVQTILQTHFVNPDESALMQIGAAGIAIFMILVYGVSIPSLWSAEEFVRFVQRWTGVLVLISLLLLPVAPGAVFKGGRFIGVFKHIPHMVTCATIAYIFSLGTFLIEPKLKHKFWNGLILVTSFLAIILTGTRSSAAAALLAFVVTMIMHKTKTNHGRIFKFAFMAFAVTFAIFFGPKVYEFAQGVATGQNSLGGREAQDGVASRWEEVERGSEIFLEEPWLGHGLLSKFAAGNDVDVSNYNAMKDPHNIFVSAGVIGGWPFLILSGFALLLMTIGSFKTLMVTDISKRQIAIYMLAHIPILVIYHVHLSIGGMADRMYWMVFGFLAASGFRSEKSRVSQGIQNSDVTKN